MVSEKLIRQLFRTQDQAVIRRLSEISETVIYKKRQEIHKAGETYTHFYMLLRGAVYTYFYDEHQHPVVLCFFSEKNVSDTLGSLGLVLLYDVGIEVFRGACACVAKLCGNGHNVGTVGK